MFAFISGPTAVALLFLVAAYAFWKSNRGIILLALLITILQAIIHSMGMSWNAAGIGVGFLFVLLALFKIVYG
jgi:hypothetical protein